LLARQQQKSKPPNGAGEIFVSTVAEKPRAIRLYRKLASRERWKRAPDGHGFDSPKEKKQPHYQLVRRWLGD
jgi:hypothetical protein